MIAPHTPPTLSRRKPGVGAFDDSVAFACDGLEPGAVDDLNVSARMLQDLGIAQLGSHMIDAVPAHAEQPGHLFGGRRDFARVEADAAHEQPSREPLAQRVDGIAGSRLRNLREKRVRIRIEYRAQRGKCREST